MLTVLDIIHLIQYYYRTASYDYAAENVEHFRLESLRGARFDQCRSFHCAHHSRNQISKMSSVLPSLLLIENIRRAHCYTLLLE